MIDDYCKMADNYNDDEAEEEVEQDTFNNNDDDANDDDDDGQDLYSVIDRQDTFAKYDEIALEVGCNLH